MTDVMGELRSRGIAPTAENVTAMTRLIGAAGAGPAGIKPLDGNEQRQLDRTAHFQEFEDPEATVAAAPLDSVEVSTLPGSVEENVQDEITKQVSGSYPKKTGGAPKVATNQTPPQDAEVPVAPVEDEGSSMSIQDVLMGALGLGAGYKGGQMLMRGIRGGGKGTAGMVDEAADPSMKLLTGPENGSKALPAPKPKPGGPALLEDKYTGTGREKADIIEGTMKEEADARPYKAGQAKQVAGKNRITVNELKEMMKDPAARRMIKGLAKKV